MNKRELYETIKSSLTPDDFMATLNYYGLEVRKKSILCPFHNDRNFGSCMISKSGMGAKCYVCDRYFSAIDLVMHYEGFEFKDAVPFLWSNILGNSLPDMEEKERPIASFEELQFLGLAGATGKQVPWIIGMATKDMDLKKGLLFEYDSPDIFTGMYPVYKRVRADDIYTLYKNDPETALFLLQGKARETEKYYRGCFSQVSSFKRQMRECGYSEEEISAEISKVTKRIWENINRAKRLESIFEKKQIRVKKKKAS